MLPQSRLARVVAFVSLTAAILLALALLWLRPGDLGPVAIQSRFALTDQNGRSVSEADFAGRLQLVFLGYTHCPGPCPAALNNMALALDRLDPVQRAKIVPIFVTLDPERDNPAVLKDYLANFGADFVGLTGSPAAIQDAAAAFKVYAKKLPSADPADYYLDHTTLIYLMDGQGAYLAHFSGEAKPETLLAGIAPYL